ncbi:MAG: PD40 domain-containing protein [Candidatus Eisenbacteria bacterium]|nr:PD40 domain-containing protein [Candidatus Eisenbacteria bacterium]
MDLRLSGVTETTVALEWTAPGSDGSDGTATSYDLRFSLSEITEENWATATPATGVPRPRSGGTAEAFTVTGLERVQIFFFALRALDSAGNPSPLSNTVTATTLTARRLTTSARTVGALAPDWSPDGERIVFQADWDEAFHEQLYVIDADGGEAEKLTNVGLAWYPRWSPDGQRIAFVLSRDWEKGLYEIAVMDAVPFASPTVVASHGLDYALTTPTWSPDGTRIAYVANTRTGPVRTSDLYIVSAQGGAPKRLAGGWSILGIDWSPDGSKIAYASNQDGNMDIWTVSVGGGTSEQLTSDVAQDATPVWSPDGTKIVYAAYRGGNYDLWIMTAAGEERRQITRGVAQDGDESWSPDGRFVVYGSFANEIGDIWVVGVE